MNCAGQPKPCLFFAGLGSPVVTDHCGSFDKIWDKDSVCERRRPGLSTCSMSPELREFGSVGQAGECATMEIWHHPHWTEVPGDTVTHTLVSELSGSYEVAAGISVRCFTPFFRTCIWKVFRGALRSKWEWQGFGQVEMHFWVTAETKSIWWKNSSVLHSQTFWMLWSQKFSVWSPARCGLTLRWTFEF